jgi:hypothetical protein
VESGKWRRHIYFSIYGRHFLTSDACEPTSFLRKSLYFNPVAKIETHGRISNHIQLDALVAFSDHVQ